MKKIILALLFCLFCSVSYAGEVTLHWDANVETNVTGYKIHWGIEKDIYTNTADAGNVLSYVLPLDAGEYYITVTAYDINGNESDYSYAILYEVKLSEVKGIGVS